MLTAVGLGDVRADDEAAICRQLRRRIEDAGVGWRSEELPWTPSFLPYLLDRTNEYRDGPAALLQEARELRTTKAVADYRKLRADFLSEVMPLTRAVQAERDIGSSLGTKLYRVWENS